MIQQKLKIRNARTNLTLLKNENISKKNQKIKKIIDKLNALYEKIEIPDAAITVLRNATISDVGNAERFLSIFKDKYIYINKEWYIFNDKFFEKIDEIQLYENIINVLRFSRYMFELSCTEQYNDYDAEAILLLIHAENESRLRSALHIAAAKQIVKTEQMNKNAYLFNTDNCTIDLQNEIMYSQKREDYITQIAKAEFDAAASNSVWEKFVSEVFQDEEVRHYIQKFFGYCLTALTNEHKLLILVGAGRNGKSTFVNAIANVLGTYATTIDPEILLKSRADFNGRPTPYLMKLHNKRLAIASETRRGRSLNNALIKNITSDDTITARNLYRDSVEFKPTHKLVLMTNYVPELDDVDDLALRKRLIIVHCDAQFEKLDRTLPTRLAEKENMAAILNWLLEGYENYTKEGLDDLPVTIKDTMSKYYEKNDELGQFITECCIVDKDEIIKLTDFMIDYNNWRDENGYKKATSKNVRESLERRGFQYKVICNSKTDRKSIRAVIGLCTFSIASEAEREKAEQLAQKQK